MQNILLFGEPGQVLCDTVVNNIMSQCETCNQKEFTIYLAAGKKKHGSKILADTMQKHLANKFKDSDFTVVYDELFTRKTSRVLIGKINKERTWGTFEESLVFIQKVRSSKLQNIILVSRAFHLPRIKIIWKLLAPDISYSVLSVEENVGITTYIKEFIKTIEAICFYGILKIFGEKIFEKISHLKNQFRAKLRGY